MRKFLLIFTAFLLCVSMVIPANATGEESRQLFRNDEYIYEVMSDGSVLIHYYIGFDDNVTVPAYIENKPVSTIGERAFYGTDIKSVSISEGITALGDEVFFYCYKLESAVLPESIKQVGTGVFRDCMKLKSVTFTQGKGKLGLYMFYGCVSLTEVNLPQNADKVETGMFGYCTSLREITIPSSVRIINGYAFYSSGLVSVDLPPLLMSINQKAFAQSKQLMTVNHQSYIESVVSMSSDAFEGCPVIFPEDTDPTESGSQDSVPAASIPQITTSEACPDTVPPCETSSIAPDPTEILPMPGTDGPDDSTQDEVTSSEDSFTVMEGYYMGDEAGFYDSEEKVISSAHQSVEKSRQELLSLAWNVRMLGDSDKDGAVNIKDATMIQRFSAGLVNKESPEFDYKNSDANTDGQVNIKDATAVQKLAAGLIDSLY